jgi:hypothetical protein
MPPDLLLMLAGAMVAGFVQGISGFAFAMVAMSFWVWGIEPRTAAVLALFGSISGQLMAAFSVRRSPHWAVLLPMLAGGLLGIPLGVHVLPLVNADLFKLGLGLVLVLWCPTMLFASSLPRITHGGRVADGLIGAIGGVMGGLGGFTGVVPTLWCTLRGWDKTLQRTVIQNFNLATQLVTAVAYLSTGAVTMAMLPRFAVVVPAVMLMAFLGTRVYVGLSDLAFRRIVLATLTASGATMLVSSLSRLLR